MSLLEKLFSERELRVYGDMTRAEEEDITRTYGVSTVDELLDNLDEEIAMYCREVLKETGSRSISDFIDYVVAVHYCPRFNKYVIEQTIFKGDEADKIAYVVVDDFGEATAKTKSLIEDVIEYISTYISELEGDPDLADLVSALRREKERLEELLGEVTVT